MDKIFKTFAVPALAAAMLVACGGGDDPPPPPGPLAQVPDSASASSAGLVSYLGALAAANADGETAEPLALDRFNPQQPEDTEPEPVS